MHQNRGVASLDSWFYVLNTGMASFQGWICTHTVSTQKMNLHFQVLRVASFERERERERERRGTKLLCVPNLVCPIDLYNNIRECVHSTLLAFCCSFRNENCEPPIIIIVNVVILSPGATVCLEHTLHVLPQWLA